MIVKNEAHVVTELLDSVAPYITSWVIVDTGSDDGTQALIKGHMAALDIRGELYERPWHDFGHNRTEALALAQGHGDYIWVMDADDLLVGTPDFSELDAEVYSMRIAQGAFVYWRSQLFRNGAPVRYRGVVHEGLYEDRPCTKGRLEGDYRIESRRLGARNQDPRKYERDRDLLLAEVQRNPADARSVFHLAQTYFDMGEFANARTWYARRVELGGWDQEVYYAMWRVAESMSRLDAPWPDVQDAYLAAFEFRPTRVEALYALAAQYRIKQRHQLAYLFAARAAQIPLPDEDILFVATDIHAFRALDQLAVCAYWIGNHTEAFTLCRQLLTRAGIPDEDRRRIAANRDFSVPTMIEAASSYPAEVADTLVTGPPDAEVTVSLIADPNRAAVEATLNSFLHCCLDISRAGRFLVLDAGLSAPDRATLGGRYRFVEFVGGQPDDAPDARLARLRAQIGGRFWLHLGQGWQFFAPDNLIGRLTGVLDTEPDVFQVAINFTDATQLTGTCAAEETVRRSPGAGRYILTDTAATGPAMVDTTRLDHAADTGCHAATLDEVLCTSVGAH